MAFSPLPYIHPSLFCVCVSIFSRFQVSIARLAWTHFEEAPSHVQCLKSYVAHCVRLLQTCIHYHWILPAMCPHFAQGCLMAWNQFAAVRGRGQKKPLEVAPAAYFALWLRLIGLQIPRLPVSGDGCAVSPVE